MGLEGQEGDATVHQLLIESQSSLYAFISSLLGGTDDAWDVLQEANFAILSKADEYEPSRSFLTWACRFAQLQVLAYRKRRRRDRLCFDGELVDMLAIGFTEGSECSAARIDALAKCIKRLPDVHRSMLAQHYEQGRTHAQIATGMDKTPGAICVLMCRIRKQLFACIQRTVAMERLS